MSQPNSIPSPQKPGKLADWLDRAARSIAAGLSLAELRALARGDPPTERPNPRYRAHVLSMLLHIRPRSYYRASTWFTHTFRLGFFTTFFFFMEVVTGIILMMYYIPSPEGAYESILRIHRDVPFGEIMRDIHRLAAEGMVVMATLHLLRTFLTASYKSERRFTWLTGVLLLLLTLFLAFSGYLLPWDQLAYWAVTIGTSMAASVPLIGEWLVTLLRGSSEIGLDGLLRFYLLHVVLLPLLVILVLSAHYYRIARIHGISLPARVEAGDLPPQALQEAKRKIDFIPDLLIHEILLIILGVLALFAVAYFFYDAPLESHANPFRTPLETQAPWFFLWVQGMLKLGNKTTWGVIVPLALFALLFTVPYLDRNPSRLARKRLAAIGFSLLALIALAGLSYMGTGRYGIAQDPAVAIVQEIAPDEHSGAFHSVPFEQLPVGVFPTGSVESGDLPEEFRAVFARFDELIRQAQAAGDLPEAQAWLIVEERQAGLKCITLRIQWLEPGNEAPTTYERRLFLHRDHLASQRRSETTPAPDLGVYPPAP